MGILSSKPNTPKDDHIKDYYYGIFNTFFSEYIEVQPSDYNGPPFVMSFNQLSAAFYSYIVDVEHLMKRPQGVDHTLYYNIYRYAQERNDRAVLVWGSFRGTGEDRRYDNTMISGIRLAKVPFQTKTI